MLMDRIMGAFTFKREVYADVKKDASFTPTAWGIVIVVNVLNQLASFVAAGAVAAAAAGALGGVSGLGSAVSSSFLGSIVSMLIGVVAFAVGVWVVMFVAKQLFQATATFDELLRPMGLAYVWGIVGFLSILAIITPLLLCLVGIVGLVGAVLSAVSMAIAIKEALGLDWTQTIITIVIAWVAIFIVSAVLGGIVAGISLLA